ncbi:molybdate ABC transporter substrate-binding protein [Carboxydochorda subterranea]|uniref:Molybdate ABC transporter substrate-binding protein n=1 Tax=Carboxydichorda subterranea TaxID=3109565 RepID=A0ABZ1C1I8_9FIRM|nr:molybdate ABC transporter substrate-binding protein [Limnochorda sp. L945t]WRP18661.1 molybdate ABC transporter substrate-binding protein [Limnochorda sp. L945t]
MQMRRMIGVLALAVVVVWGGPAAGARRTDLLVSAAASLTDLLREAKTSFEARHPDVNVQLNMGSSGSLQRQIEQGAPVDVFISVSQAVTDSLVKQGFIDGKSVRVMARNVVVLVRPAGGGPGGTLRGWQDLRAPQVRRIALGNPAHVPAGQYGEEVLESLGLWEAVQPKLVLGEDVRQTLAYVQAGEVDAGIVYATDAAIAGGKVQVVATAPEGSHRPVVYPVAVLRDAPHPQEARAFVEWLLSDEVRAMLEKYGFLPGS